MSMRNNAIALMQCLTATMQVFSNNIDLSDTSYVQAWLANVSVCSACAMTGAVLQPSISWT